MEEDVCVLKSHPGIVPNHGLVVLYVNQAIVHQKHIRG